MSFPPSAARRRVDRSNGRDHFILIQEKDAIAARVIHCKETRNDQEVLNSNSSLDVCSEHKRLCELGPVMTPQHFSTLKIANFSI